MEKDEDDELVDDFPVPNNVYGSGEKDELKEEASSGKKKGGPRSRKGTFKRVAKVSGTVVSAVGLSAADTFGSADPYVVVKGIRANNHLVNIFLSNFRPKTCNPEWNESFEFLCPAHWGVVDLVGLKFLVYDTDDETTAFTGSADFLGGADLDLAKHPASTAVQHIIDLAGDECAGPNKKTKPRLVIELRIDRIMEDKPPRFPIQIRNDLLSGLRTFSKVKCKIKRAENLKNADIASLSDPFVEVRAINVRGEAFIVHRTPPVPEDLNPEFNARFDLNFENTQDVFLLAFDVWDDDQNETAEKVKSHDAHHTRDHLGTAVLSLYDCLVQGPKTLELQGEHQLHESLRAMQESAGGRATSKTGDATAAANAAKTASQGSTSPTLHRGGHGGHGGHADQVRNAVSSSADLAPEDYLQEGDRSVTRKLFNLLSRGLTVVKRFGDVLKEGARSAMEDRGNLSTLTVDLRVKMAMEDMPHCNLLTAPFEVTDLENCATALDTPDWERSGFTPPPELLATRRPRRGALNGVDKIVFISGMVHGCNSLRGKNGVPSPYCMIFGMSPDGSKVLLHKTRILQKTPCPLWMEAFYFPCNENLVISGALILIYDGESGAPGSKQDYLGRAAVDLTGMLNGQKFYECVPLLVGANKEDKNEDNNDRKRATGFRMNPTISLEFRVERRVKPFYTLAEKPENALTTRTYTLSRFPPMPAYVDYSQNRGNYPDLSAASQLFALIRKGQLLESARERVYSDLWLKAPTRAAIAEEEEELVDANAFADLLLEDKVVKAVEDKYEDFTDCGLKKPMVQAVSLPSLHTRFRPGGTFREHPLVAPDLPTADFADGARSHMGNVASNFAQRPAPEYLVMRSHSGP